MKNLNRIKFVLVEKKKQGSGWQKNSVKALVLSTNGVQTLRN